MNCLEGQTLEALGLYLMRRVFTHGQLYLGLTRVGSPNDISCCPGNQLDNCNMFAADGCYYTVNVVYKWPDSIEFESV